MEIPFNMLLLPLLGGYIFVRFWRYTWIHVLRSDKERLIIRASLAGLASLILTFFIYTIVSPLIPCPQFGICIPSWWVHNVPFEYSGISFAAFWVAALGWIPLNWWFSEKDQIDRAIREDADPLEMLLKRAQDEYIQVAITMCSGKVYVGFITHKFNPSTPTNFIGILPLHSGYRDETTKRVMMTTPYANIYETMNCEVDDLEIKLFSAEKKREEYARLSDKRQMTNKDKEIEILKQKLVKLTGQINCFGMTIPVNQIASINLYDSEVHQKYFLDKYNAPVTTIQKVPVRKVTLTAKPKTTRRKPPNS